jgi:hypothetical protein
MSSSSTHVTHGRRYDALSAMTACSRLRVADHPPPQHQPVVFHPLGEHQPTIMPASETAVTFVLVAGVAAASSCARRSSSRSQ